jgi:ABC-type transporter Mla subunit MlaD
MTEEKIANELLELITETVQGDMKYIVAGLDNNARQLGALRQQLNVIQDDFARLGRQAEALSEQLRRFEKIARPKSEA